MNIFLNVYDVFFLEIWVFLLFILCMYYKLSRCFWFDVIFVWYLWFGYRYKEGEVLFEKDVIMFYVVNVDVCDDNCFVIFKLLCKMLFFF